VYYRDSIDKSDRIVWHNLIDGFGGGIIDVLGIKDQQY